MEKSVAPISIGLVTPYRWTIFNLVNEQVAGLAHQLRLLGHTVAIFAPGDALEAPHSLALPTRAVAALDTSQRAAFDLVHFFEPLASIRTALALARAPWPAVATFYGAKGEPALDGLGRVVTARALSRLACRIAGSPSALRISAARFPALYRLVRPGTDLVRQRGSVARAGGAPLRVLYPLPSPAIAPDRLTGSLEALRPLLDADSAEQIALTLASWHGTPPASSGLNVPGVSAAVMGVENELDDLLAGADVLYLGAEDEHSELLIARAMAAGKPVVAPRTPGLRDSVREWHDGLLVPARDASALAGALRRLAGNEDLRARLASNARLTASRYAWPLVASRIAAIYQEAVAQVRTAA